MSIALIASILIEGINLATELHGTAMDYFGIRGGLEVILATTIWNLVPSGVGTAAGYFSSGSRSFAPK